MLIVARRKKTVPRLGAGARKQISKDAAWTLRRARGLRILQTPALARLDWLVHGFSTRPGGASKLKTLRDGREKNESVLNLGFTDWDERERVLDNRAKFFAAVGAGRMRVVALRQIHSDIVHRVDAAETVGADGAPQGDALFTRARGVLLVVQTADCIPILLADTKHRAVAAIHAGWRGTLRRIAEKTLGRMHMELGTQATDVIVALGPGIGRCCYEVGEDVAKEFSAQFMNAQDWFEGPFDGLASGENDPNWLPWLTRRPPGHPPPAPRVRLDLIAANRALLAGAGIAPAKIFSSGLCTACRPDLAFSYRREKTTGRMMAAIGIR
jgi:purine-nucleoside/S-methyl-5'-thioadenosine phosphorylase / adenosine deaminase